MSLVPGSVVGGKYRIIRLIGDGGMGRVYEARHQLLGTPVALKFLLAELAERPGLAERFLREARVAAAIQSPHVARVTDVDRTPEGAPYLVMELLTGESLQALMDREHKLPRDQAIDLALQVLAGLEAAHACGVVHRDLKPDNVFVTPGLGGPLLKLIDFGIAKLKTVEPERKGLTRAGALMGTPEYMAPEQVSSAAEVDQRADIYSFGVMLYEMLTGERPVQGDEALEIASAVAQGLVTRVSDRDPSIPPGLATLIHRAMAADPRARYETAFELRQALIPFAGELSRAGRLAAAPEHVAPPELAGPMSEVLSQAQASPPSPTQTSARHTDDGVAPTLPPDDPVVPQVSPSAATQEAPAGSAGVMVAQPSHDLVPPRRGRRRRRPWLVVSLSLTVVAAAAIAVAVALERPRLERPPLPVYAVDADPAPTNITAEGTSTPYNPEVFPTFEPEPPRAGPPQRPTPDGSRDAGAATPFPPFVLPSTLPPLPSVLPPLPTEFPTAWPTALPQIPGFTAPAAPSTGAAPSAAP